MFDDTYETRVCGIPCKIEVTEFSVEYPSADCPGGGDWAYKLYDRKGYRAKWLEAKVTDDEDDRLYCEHLKRVENYRPDYYDDYYD